MIGKFVKFIVKLAIRIVILTVVSVYLIHACVEYARQTQAPTEDITYMLYAYENSIDCPIGMKNICPQCGKYFERKTNEYVCCSRECEKTYWQLIDAWEETEEGRKFIESHGKNFK